MDMDYVEKLVDPKQLPNLLEDALDYAHVRFNNQFFHFCFGVWALSSEHPNTRLEVMSARMHLLLCYRHLSPEVSLNKQ